MAFGKNPEVLASVGSFRQKALQHTAARNARPAGGKTFVAPSFTNKFQPAITGEADIIRLIAGDYEIECGDQAGNITITRQPYFSYCEHFHGTLKRGSICSAGPLSNFKDQRQPCYGCDLFWSLMTTDERGKRVKGPMSKRDMTSFTVVHYKQHHKAPKKDVAGKVIANKQGVPYYEYVPCTGRNCDMCKMQLETIPAHQLHWDIGQLHFSTLLQFDAEIGKSCSVCGGKKTIHREALVCPGCGATIVDMKTTQLTDEEIDSMYEQTCKCPECNAVGFLDEIISCDNCTPAGRTPTRATLFDVDLHVKRQATAGSNATTLIITEFSAPRPCSFPDLAKPLPLDKIFAPTSMEKQAAEYGLGPDQIAALADGSFQPLTRGRYTPGNATVGY